MRPWVWTLLVLCLISVLLGLVGAWFIGTVVDVS